MQNSPAARLAACCALALSLWACGGSGGPDGADTEGTSAPPAAGGSTDSRAPSTAPAPAPGGGGATSPATPPALIGVQPVPDTPVASLPSHADHEPIVPGVVAAASTPAQPQFRRDLYVAPTGDDANDGSQARPFRTIMKAVSVAGPGDGVHVASGTYAEKLLLEGSAPAGTEEAKITLQGEGSPRIVPVRGAGGGLIEVGKPGWVIDGFELDVQGEPQFAVMFAGDVTGSVLANSELHGGTLGGAVTTHAGAKGARIENNHIHDFQRTGSKDGDSHGVIVQAGSRDIVVRNNDIHDVSGDSVQCLGPEGVSKAAPAKGLTIENNHFYGNRENAVDIKTCHDVTIRNNRMHRFSPSTTARGEALVVHYSAKDVLVEGNLIYDAAKGIAVGGNREGPPPEGIVVRRNRVRDMKTAGGGEGTGIRVENATGPRVEHNTVSDVQGAALIVGGGTGGASKDLVLKNNLFDGRTEARIGAQAPGLQMAGNIFPGAATFFVDGKAADFTAWRAEGSDTTSGQADPGVGRADFTPGAAAVDKGVKLDAKFCGAAPDVGAVETGC